jgi:hypothetical protein
MDTIIQQTISDKNSEFLHKFATVVQMIRNMKIREDAAMDLLRQNESCRKSIEPKMNELVAMYRELSQQIKESLKQ